MKTKMNESQEHIFMMSNYRNFQFILFFQAAAAACLLPCARNSSDPKKARFWCSVARVCCCCFCCCFCWRVASSFRLCFSGCIFAFFVLIIFWLPLVECANTQNTEYYVCHALREHIFLSVCLLLFSAIFEWLMVK